MKRLLFILFWICASSLKAQNDTLSTQDQIYNRPFIGIGKTGSALGGYVEANSNYFSTDGVSEGFSMELRRFNLFVFSSIGPRIRFLSEIEFEHGVEEINLETAMLDFKVNSMINFRAGILLTPIGGFNQNHDSPRWEIIDRPLVSTTIIPSTLSEVGFGFHGKKTLRGGLATYDVYLLNGLGSGLVLNASGRTSTQDAKSPEMFGEDANGTPMASGKLSLRSFKAGEIGLSWYGGVYNQFKVEGTVVDEKRRMDLFALDFNTQIGKLHLHGEAAMNLVQVQDSIESFFGEKQSGFFLEGNLTLMERAVLKWQKTRLLASLRLESVDYNMGQFRSTGGNIFDHVHGLTAGLSLRPNANAVLRLNYRLQAQRDLIGNAAEMTSGIQVGVASYF
jgi:hypothetical protein